VVLALSFSLDIATAYIAETFTDLPTIVGKRIYFYLKVLFGLFGLSESSCCTLSSIKHTIWKIKEKLVTP
jgi:hypothetical protein